jgi:geranylgeranyl reductase family protein
MTFTFADVVVVGAGPAGSIAARESARRGLRCILLEARRLPRPKVCAGGISPRGRRLLRELGLWEEIAALGYAVEGIRLGGPSGREVELLGAESAIVVPRSVLDERLARQAAAAGAELRDGVAVRGLLREHGRVIGVETERGEIRARWVVAADGANTRFSTDPRPRHVLHTCMAWYESFPFTPHVLEMFFDAELMPHYGWLFPEPGGTVNIGLCVEPARRGGLPIRRVFRRFLDRHFACRLAGARPLGDWRGHPIVVSDSFGHHAEPGVLLVGEACRLVNAATGEGIAYAIQSGMLAARALADGLRCGDDVATVTAAYTRSVRWALELPLRGGELFRSRGVELIDPLVRLGRHPLFRRFAKQKQPASPDL